MAEKITLRNAEDENDEERQPLNTMVADNLKEIIIRKIYRDVDRNVSVSKAKVSTSVARQYLTAVGPVISTLSCGMAAGYSAVLLPQLMADDTEIPITKEEGSWIASLMALPLIFGCLVSGYLLDLMGRKRSQIVFCVPFAIGWVVQGCSTNVIGLCAGRLITGFCVGLLSPVVQVYIAESSQPDQRGILLSGSPLAVAIGILLSHVLGTFFSWRVTAWLCGLPPVLSIVIIAFMKESPVWLLQKGKLKEAKEAFEWVRGDSEEAAREFNDLLSKGKGEAQEDGRKGVLAKLKACLNPSFLKPFLVLNFFFFVQQFSGVNAVAFYSVSILKKMMTMMDEYYSTLLIDVVRFIASIAAVILLKRFGRKQLAVTSSIGTSISLFLLTLYLGCVNPERGSLDETANFTSSPLNFTKGNESFLAEVELSQSPESGIIDYLPLIFLIFYICFVSLGLVPLPWVLTGELFSKEMRGIGSGVTSSFGFLCYFIVVKSTPDMFEKMNDYGTFCLFGVIAMLGSLVLSVFLPETKDKTLAEIEAHFNKKKSKSAPPEQINMSNTS